MDFILNLTTGAVTQVSWPDYPAIIESPQGRLVQVHFWDSHNGKWTMLVPRPSGQVAEGWAEVTVAEVITLVQACAAGDLRFVLSQKG